MDATTDIDLSIAQVEADLRAAEAYLTSDTGASRGDANVFNQTEETSPYDHIRQPNGAKKSSYFKRPTRARTPISEERRKQILEKLSSDRQAAVRGHVSIPSMAASPIFPYEDGEIEENEVDEPLKTAQINSDETLRNASGDHDRIGTRFDYHNDFQKHNSARASDIGDDDEYVNGEDDGEVFYASDVIGKSVHEHIQPRTALDLFNMNDERDDDSVHSNHSLPDKHGPPCEDGVGELDTTIPTNYRSLHGVSTPYRDHSEKMLSAESIFAKVLAHRDDWCDEADNRTSQFLAPTPLNDDLPASSLRRSEAASKQAEEDLMRGPEDEQVSNTNHRNSKVSTAERPGPSDNEPGYESLSRKSLTTPTATPRIEALARPRTRIFADREKQRLMNEMESLKECTFQPALLKATKHLVLSDFHRVGDPGKRRTKSTCFGSNTACAGTAFPWLTLSPRRKSTSRKTHRRRHTLVDRLHLDVSVKYEARERLREMLETEKMRECTFQPKINSTSRRLLSRTEYKPIHERIDDVQREKVEYIQRIREELAYEEGAFTFTPQINPRSREIAETVLCEKQVSKIRASTRQVDLDDEHQLQAMLRPPAVTERLVHDAEQIAEKRVAVQAYYDALEEKSFAPIISETSTRLVEAKPEFKLDFLSRQEYFRLVEQEKLEALEDVVHQEQELVFRPDIGNAEKVLREMRPDLVHETSQQRLDRLVYHEPRRKEMIKQRLRDESYSKLPFKPEINLVSKALVEKAKLEAATKGTRRHELQRYFVGKQFRSRVAQELEQAEKAECTFRPQLISRPKVKSSSTSKLLVSEKQQTCQSVWHADTILHTIETQRQQRAEDLESKRNALELKELENCTFQPNIHHPRQRALSDSAKKREKAVVVRGLERFLELKERALRQQAERKKREEKIFYPNRAYEPRSYTVPKPFKLSETSKDSIRRRLKLREEVRSKERTECTFAPRTLEAQQRQVLRALLKN